MKYTKDQKEKWLKDNFLICGCGYHNKKEWTSYFGTCNRCRKVLDKKAYFKYEMNKRLRLWKGE